MSNKERINLLTDVDVEKLYARPQFNEAEREHYFRLNEDESQLVGKYTGVKTKVYLILQIGFFKAEQQFYNFSFDEVKEDTHYIIKRYFNTLTKGITGKLWHENCRNQQLEILNLYHHSEWSAQLKPKALGKLKQLIRIYPKGNDTLREFFVFLKNEKITIPSYRTLQDLLTHAFKSESLRLSKITTTIPENLKQQLEEIIKNDGGLTQLNIMRCDQKDFSYTALKLEVKKAKKIHELYQLCKALVPSLKLSNNAVRYYAALAEQYSASRIRRLKKPQQWLHVLCFIFHRYQEFMDNLITDFLFYVRSFLEGAKEYAEEKEDQYLKALMMGMPNLGEFLKWYSSKEISPKITTPEAFRQLGFDIFPRETQMAFAEHINGSGFNRQAAKWEYYEKQAQRIAMYLRPILCAVDFEFYKKEAFIVKLMKTLRDYYLENKPTLKLSESLPTELTDKIPDKSAALLQSSDKSRNIHPARFEFYVYDKMCHQIDRGRLFCNNSVSYGSLDHDLVPDELVDKADEICEQLGYKKIPIYCDERLDEALSELEVAWIKTNENIDNGCNTGVTIKTDESGMLSWSLSYDADDNKSSAFFNGLTQTDIADVMKLMGDFLKIWPIFSSLKDRYVKYKQPNPLALIACILADAFGFGIKKMSEISNISYNHLLTVDGNFMHVDCLKMVSDVFSDFIHGLPVSRTWDLIENTIIADADGQKYETSHHTIQSRYSSKYFGTYKGISIYSLVANYIPVNSKVIGPNEHESHHLYDVLYNNQANISIDMVTGDNHSLNQANFVALDSIDIAFIPSIKNIREEAEKLYSVHDVDRYDGLIKPCGKIKTSLIKSEKRGIIRILLSLLLQQNTQAVIIRKLSSHKRYCRLQKALWEYNKIFKSTHVLNVVNDTHLRKVIKTARNRTESYHQLQRTIRKVYSGTFKGRKIVSNAISNQASRLVANCIIAYNAMMLDQLYQRLCVTDGEERAKTTMSKISPVAWQHLIFTGRYHFKDQEGKINMGVLIAFLEKKLRNSTG
jgi:TnpA family transposase